MVKELRPENGECNILLHVWTHQASDHAGGYQPPVMACHTIGHDDYAYAANLVHVLDGYRLACICSEAFRWDSETNPAPAIQ